MSGRRRLLLAGGGPADGLVFYASLTGDTAETGQRIITSNGFISSVFDDELQCNVMQSEECSAATFSCAGFPSGNNPFSMSIWVKAMSSYLYDTVYLGWGNAPHTGGLAAISTSRSSSNTYFTKWSDELEDGPVRAGRWTHYAGTFDGTNAIFYVDGEMIAQKVMKFEIGTETGAFGTWWAPGDILAPVRRANARIYNRALRAAEIKTLAGEIRL